MARQVGDETVILDLASGTYFGLDPVGARIWQLIGEGVGLDDICETLLAEFDTARETVTHDVNRLIGELQAQGLVIADRP
jgi:hypothetical protein